MKYSTSISLYILLSTLLFNILVGLGGYFIHKDLYYLFGIDILAGMGLATCIAFWVCEWVCKDYANEWLAYYKIKKYKKRKYKIIGKNNKYYLLVKIGLFYVWVGEDHETLLEFNSIEGVQTYIHRYEEEKKIKIIGKLKV